MTAGRRGRFDRRFAAPAGIIQRRARLPATVVDVQDLFESHLTVTDLTRAIHFYERVLGLRLAHVASSGQAAFFWIGSAGTAMLGVWTAGAAPQRITSHTAFRVTLDAVIDAPARLRAAGVVALDFDGQPADEPVVLGWMPAASVYFLDPDGNLLEYLAMLPDDPRPEMGVVPWRVWQNAREERDARGPERF